MNNKTTKLFVYGTLKKGFPLQSYLATSKFVSKDEVYGELYDLGAFPAFIRGLPDRTAKIKGEVYDVPTEVFESVKRMEENAGYETSGMLTCGGRAVRIFVYKNQKIRNRFKMIREYEN